MPITTWTSRLVKKEHLTADVIKLSFTVPEDFSFKAGQFIYIRVKKGGESKLKAYSILNPPSQKNLLDICIKIVPGGFASEIFKDTKVDESFELKGPFGHFTFNENDQNKEFWFLATGTGVTPFYSMLYEYLETYKTAKFKLFFGVRYKNGLFFHNEFLKLAEENKNFTYIPTLSQDQWEGHTGRINQHFGEDLKHKTFYICGLKEFVIETKDYLISKGVEMKDIVVERYN